MKWAGHIIRMKDDRTTKRVLLARPTGDRKRGRPRLRWADCLQGDFNTIKVKDWKAVARRRKDWHSLLEKAKVHPGLSSY